MRSIFLLDWSIQPYNIILEEKIFLVTTVLGSHANILGAITNLGGGEFCTPALKAPEKTSLNSVFLLCFQSALYIHVNDCCYIMGKHFFFSLGFW